MNCPECGGVIQASRSEWFTFDADPAIGTYTDSGEFHIYCVNDHDLDGNEAVEAWVEERMAQWEEKARA